MWVSLAMQNLAMSVIVKLLKSSITNCIIPKDSTREVLHCMEICDLCKKQLVMKSIIAIIDLKVIDIAKELHISKSLISRHLTGDLERPEVDIYIIEKLLGIKIEGYKFTDERVKN